MGWPLEKGLITADGPERVMRSASRELADVPFDKPEQHAERQAERHRDFAAARTALGR